MAKRSSKSDVNQIAVRILGEATGEQPKTSAKSETKADASKNPAAVALGRLGGLKGGKARAAKLSKDERSKIAKLAAKMRWLSRTNGRDS